MNQVALCGRIGNDIELKKTAGGISVTEFSIAVNRQRRSDGAAPETDWIDIQAWRGTAEFIKRWFGKGEAIIITGSLRAETWTDNEGNRRKRVFVLADNVEFVPKGKAQNAEATAAQGNSFDLKPATLPNAVQENTGATLHTEEFEQMNFSDEDLPF